MSLPNNHPDMFSGEDVIDYRPFILSFDRLIDKKCTSAEDKYYYLLHFTSGGAKQLVASCHNSNASEAYKQARQLLENTYGNEHILAQKYLDKLYQWETIKSEDSKELCRFSSFLTTCLSMMTNMSALSQLNSLRDIKEILLKLPYDLRKSFRSLANKRTDAKKSVDFELLVNFVNDHAKERSMPLLGDISDSKRKNDPSRRNEKSKTFYVNKNETLSCECCKKTNHALNGMQVILTKVNRRP